MKDIPYTPLHATDDSEADRIVDTIVRAGPTCPNGHERLDNCFVGTDGRVRCKQCNRDACKRRRKRLRGRR